jgi:uncharacterized protein (TIGR02001 family)
MKKIIAVAVASSLAAMTASAGTSASVDIATAYVYRGVTVVDDLVIQPGIEIDGFGMPEEYGNIAIGVWGSTAPFSDTYDNLHETDWYVTYTLPELVSNMNFYVGFTEYMYPVPIGEKEINLGVDYLLGDFLLGASANFMVDDDNQLTESQKYFDFFADYEIEVSEDADVTVGGLISIMLQGDGNSAVGLDDGFNHAELYGTFTYALSDMWDLGASLAYIFQLDSDVLPNALHDKGLVATFSIGCSM